jgi:hypothetical protein
MYLLWMAKNKVKYVRDGGAGKNVLKKLVYKLK